MDRRRLPLNALRAFEGVGRHLSFTAAANSLLVSQSAVSRHVIALEDLLGVQLFERRPHKLLLTEAGKALLPVVSKAFDRIATTLDEVKSSAGPRRRGVRVLLPPSFAHNLAVPILSDFRKDCPDVVLEIESPYGVGPPTRECDLAVVYARPHATDSITDLLWSVRLTPVCHPDLAPRPGTGLAAFIAASDVLHVHVEGESRYRFWERFVRQNELADAAVDRGLVFDTVSLAAQYALSGGGIALLDPKLYEAELRSGALVRPFDVWLDEGYGYYLVTHPDDLADDVIGLFRSWLIRRFAATGASPAATEAVAPPGPAVVQWLDTKRGRTR